MDKGSNKRVALFAGLLFLVITGCVMACIGWVDTVHREELKLLGQCILMEPRTQGEYVSIFKGKTEADSGQAAIAGQEAAEKYGYESGYRSFSPALSSFLPVIISAFIFDWDSGLIPEEKISAGRNKII